MAAKKTAIVTGASRGIGAGLVEAFLNEGYSVAATSRHVSQSLTASPRLVLVDGDIGKQETAAKTVEAAIKHFGTINVLVNNAGIYLGRPFTEFTTENFNALVATNLLGFFYITQLAVKQMLKQKSGNVVTITASSADQPIAGDNGSVSMITKGGLNTVTRSLAIEYAKQGIRFNAVLGISEITVKAHRGQVMRKMEADSVADLVKIAVRLGPSRALNSSSSAHFNASRNDSQVHVTDSPRETDQRWRTNSRVH